MSSLKLHLPLEIIAMPAVQVEYGYLQEVTARMERVEERVTDAFFSIQKAKRSLIELYEADTNNDAEEEIYEAKLMSSDQVYDGDTLRDVRVCIQTLRMSRFRKALDFDDGDIEIWPGLFLTPRGIVIIRDIRINGIDTPELRVSTRNPDGTIRSSLSRFREREAAYAARDALKSFLLEHNNEMVLHNIEHGKYAGRVLADVQVGTHDVAEWMIENGHALQYFGGTKPDWGWGA